MLLDIDSIVSKSVSNGRFIYGRTKQTPRRPWSEDEKRFLYKHANTMPMSEIANELGRTTNAVKVKIVRYQIPREVKRDDEITVRDVGECYLGKCGKSIKMLIDRDLFPARELPYDDRTVHVIRERALFRWATRPANWIYFKVKRLRNPHLKSLVKRAQAEWGDKWLRPSGVIRRVKATSGLIIDDRDVNRAIRRHGLPAARWDNWHVKRSDVDAFDWASIKGGKGTPGQTVFEWSDGGDAYMVLALAVGVPYRQISENMGWHGYHRRAPYRLEMLHKLQQLTTVAAVNGVEVYGDGQIFADWRDHADRFPGLCRTAAQFVAGEDLDADGRYNLWGLLWSWAKRYAQTADQLTFAESLSHSAGASQKKLRVVYQELLSWGIAPLGSNQ